MSYLLTNQNNFKNIPYPSKANPTATVKSGGCGACAALMILENMTSQRFKMKDWISWVVGVGARVNGGTNMNTLSRKLGEKYGFEVTATSSETALKNHLKEGGMAIANVGGKRSGWSGLFSSSGHFIAVLGLLKDGRFIIGDSGIYPGKFNTTFRRSKLQVDGDLVYVNASNLHQDTLARTPNYYLFTKNPEEQTKTEEQELRYETYNALPKWAKEAVKYYMDQGTLKGDNNGKLDLSYDMVRTLCITCPVIYKTLGDCPEWAQATIKKLVEEGTLKGDGKGNFNLSLDMLRLLVLDERAIG